MTEEERLKLRADFRAAGLPDSEADECIRIQEQVMSKIKFEPWIETPENRKKLRKKGFK